MHYSHRNTGSIRGRIEQQIIEAAWCYYHDEMNQAQIAKRMGISRSTVVNYLAEARAREYVHVSLRSSVFLERELSEQLKRKFGLKDALVVPTAEDDPVATLDRLAQATADWLPTLLQPGDRLGVSWGETVFNVSEAAMSTTIPDLDIIQLVGSRATPLGFAAETCSANLAQKLGARCINLHAPLIVQNPELARLLKEDPLIAGQLEAIRTCNKTLFAAGSCGPDSHVVRSEVVNIEQLDAYLAKGAQAVVCGRFIDANGQAIPGEIDHRMIGIALDDMRGKEMGLLTSCGTDRVLSIRATLNGGFATHLATCAKTAEALIDQA